MTRKTNVTRKIINVPINPDKVQGMRYFYNLTTFGIRTNFVTL